MSKHIEAAVSAVIGRDHVADIASYDMALEDGRPALWVEVIYRGLSQGPGHDMLQDIMESVGDVSCASDPRAVVSFIAEDDLMAIAAE
ncbi:MAG: hypothetical protein AAGA70_13695 [Pseudomonadota bacterium]